MTPRRLFALVAAAFCLLPTVAPAQDGITLNLTIPQEMLDRATGAGGGNSAPGEMQALKRTRLDTLRGQLGVVAPGGLGYTCDSKTNQCTCDNNDPLDCIILIGDGECSGTLDGPDGNICLDQPGSCTCTWH